MNEGLLAGGTIIFTFAIIIVSVAAAIIPVVLILKKLGGMSAANQRLLAQGVPANARIVQVGSTGLTVNDSPQLQVTMEVQPPPAPGYRADAAPFMATTSILVPVYAMARVCPGATVPVRFDPATPANVAIDFRAMGFA